MIQDFGYSEMYEWYEVPQPAFRLGRFVTFSKNDSTKIVPVSKEDQFIIGVSTINSAFDSDDPDEWKYKNMCNEYGDLYLTEEKLAVGTKTYDQLNEMNFIRTYPWKHLVKIENKLYDKTKKYVKRSNREEWVRVNLMGKVIVFDDGKCKPGEWCKPYTGKMKELQGSAVPANENDKQKFYVMCRLSAKTIVILNK